MADVMVALDDGEPAGGWRPTEADGRQARAALKALGAKLGAEFAEATCSVLLYAKRGRTQEDRFRRLPMTADLAEQFKAEFRPLLDMTLARALDEEEGLRPYAFSGNVEDTVQFLPVDAYPTVAGILSQFPRGIWDRIYGPREDFIENLKCVHLTFELGETRERLEVIQVRGASRVLTRGIVAMLVDGAYQKIETSEVLTFLPHADFLVWRGTVFILNLDKFESFFNVREATQAIARDTLSTSLAQLPIRLQIPSSILNRPRLAKKLAGLRNADYLEALSIEQIQMQIAEHEIPARIIDVAGEPTLVLDRPDDHNIHMLLFRLLDDDLYRSSMTTRRYAARAKDRR